MFLLKYLLFCPLILIVAKILLIRILGGIMDTVKTDNIDRMIDFIFDAKQLLKTGELTDDQKYLVFYAIDETERELLRVGLRRSKYF